MSKRIFLIDSSALAYRSFYAFINNPLTTSKGEHTSAVYGFVSQILRLLENEKPTHLAVVQDLAAPTFRHEMYPEYKAHRKPMPDELRSQFPIIQNFLELSNLPTISAEGYEADDVMGTLALQGKKQGFQVYIFTKDKDMMQVIDEDIFLYEASQRGEPPVVKGIKEVKQKFGVEPKQMVDMLALMGDAADNIPGVQKVGPKTAATLLETYGTLEKLYENVDNISKKGLRQNLTIGKENAFLSQKLVQLECNVPLSIGIDDLQLGALNTTEIEGFLKQWELNSLLSHLKNAGQPVPPTPQKKPIVGNYQLLTSQTKPSFVKEISTAKVIALDTETTGLDYLNADLVGLCVSTKEKTGWYVPIAHEGENNFDLNELKKILGPVLSDSSVQFVFHNAKFDMGILGKAGLAPEATAPRSLADTLIAAHLLDPGVRGLSLDELSEKHFQHQMIPIEGLIGKKGKDQKSFSQAPVAEACQYGAEDADITFRLWKVLEPELQKKKVDGLFWDLETPLLPVLLEMERRGISVNQKKLETLSVEMSQEIDSLEKSIYKLAEEEFNISSTQQLSVILFEKLKLKTGKKTKTGYSTDAAVLTKLKGEHAIIDHLLNYRELIKLKNTYVDVLPKLIHPRTKRIHTSYSQTIAATGRLSSINPNLQNIPIRTSHGKQIRECFVPRSSDYVLLSADYSQIELRVLAHLSGDPTLTEAYQKNLDIHTRTAAILYKVSEEKVTSEQRRNAKVVNFGVIYGMGPQRLSGELGISRSDASAFIENYFEQFSSVQKYMRETVDGARKNGYVETIAGRRRYLPELASDNRMVKENAERMATNTPIQGSAADLIKKAMINMHQVLSHSKMDCEMLLQVHDELVFEVAKKNVTEATTLIKSTMEKAMTLNVPLVADVGVGQHWLEAHG